MSDGPRPPARHRATVLAVVGLALTALVAVIVVTLGKDTTGSDLVLVPRDEVASATTEPPAPYQVEEVARLDQPTQLAPRPGAADLYVTQLAGQVIRLASNGDGSYEAVERPALDISDQVSSQAGLDGLVSLTFSPDGTTLYLAYTDKANDQTVWAYPVEHDGHSFGPGKEIITIDSPPGEPNNHVGGSLAFGPDGHLYVGTGDGGAGAFQAPDTSSYYGKILRIDPDPVNGGYSSPEGNTSDGPDSLPEVWTVGLRNPFRITFDSANGDLWVADVGDLAKEEINRLGVEAAYGFDVNLGWPQHEGTDDYYIDQPSPTRIPATPPSYEYEHRQGRCAVIGGQVYRGTEFADLSGDYLFTDLCSKALLGLREGSDGAYEEFTLATVGESQLTSVDASNDGDIFLTAAGGGVYRLVAAA